MASIYEIYDNLKILEEYMVDPDTGEILSEEEFAKLYDEIEMSLQDKIENTMCYYKNLMADVETFKAEAKKITERAKVKENLANKLKSRVDYIISQDYIDEDGNLDFDRKNGFKFETPKVKLGYRKSLDNVVISNLSVVPKKYIKPRVIKETDVDKTQIKKDYKESKSVNKVLKVKGIEFEDRLGLQVK